MRSALPRAPRQAQVMKQGAVQLLASGIATMLWRDQPTQSCQLIVGLLGLPYQSCCAVACAGQLLAAATSADSPPPGALPSRSASASTPWSAPQLPGGSLAKKISAAAAATAGSAPVPVPAAANGPRAQQVPDQAAAPAQPEWQQEAEAEPMAEELPAEPPLGFMMPCSVALKVHWPLKLYNITSSTEDATPGEVPLGLTIPH